MTCFHPNMCAQKERCAVNLNYSETPVVPVYRLGRCMNFVETVKKTDKNFLTPTVLGDMGDEGTQMREMRGKVENAEGAQLQPHKGERNGRQSRRLKKRG